MDSTALKRVQKELADMANDLFGASVYHLEPSENDLLQLEGYVMGKASTPYEGGKFGVKMLVPMNYPNVPPSVSFTTKVWHPNVGASGFVCMDLLTTRWAPTITMGTLMLGLQTLLAEPAFDDPVDMNAPCQQNSNREAYEQTVAYWTYHFAMSDEKKADPELKARFSSYDEMVSKVVKATGVSRDNAVYRLSCLDWDVDATIVDCTRCKRKRKHKELS